MVLMLILLHLWLLFWLWLCAATIWGQMAHRTYEARMKSRFRWFLMPGKQSDRSVWVRQAKVLAWIGLVVGLTVYIMVIVNVVLPRFT